MSGNISKILFILCSPSAFAPGCQSEDPAVRWQLNLYRDRALRFEGPPDPEKVLDRIQRISAAVFNLEQVGLYFLMQSWVGLPDTQQVAAVTLSAPFRWSSLFDPRNVFGRNCCPSRGSERWWPASAWLPFIICPGTPPILNVFSENNHRYLQN